MEKTIILLLFISIEGNALDKKPKKPFVYQQISDLLGHSFVVDEIVEIQHKNGKVDFDSLTKKAYKAQEQYQRTTQKKKSKYDK